MYNVLSKDFSTKRFEQMLRVYPSLLKVIYFPPVDLNQAQGKTFIAMQYLWLWIQNTWLISTLPKIWSGFASQVDKNEASPRQNLYCNAIPWLWIQNTWPISNLPKNMRLVRFYRISRRPQEISSDFSGRISNYILSLTNFNIILLRVFSSNISKDFNFAIVCLCQPS